MWRQVSETCGNMSSVDFRTFTIAVQVMYACDVKEWRIALGIPGLPITDRVWLHLYTIYSLLGTHVGVYV